MLGMGADAKMQALTVLRQLFRGGSLPNVGPKENPAQPRKDPDFLGMDAG